MNQFELVRIINEFRQSMYDNPDLNSMFLKIMDAVLDSLILYNAKHGGYND